MKQSSEVTEEDIKELSDKTSIDEEYLRDSVQSQRADNKYEDSVLDSDFQSNNINIGEKIKNAIKFVFLCFFPNPTIPNYAKVVNIKSPEEINKIIIKTKTEYAKIPTQNEEFSGFCYKEHEFDLSSSKDKEKLNKLVDGMNVSRPSDLEDKKIPTTFVNTYKDKSRNSKSRKRYRFYPFNYKIDIIHSEMTNIQKINRYINRVLMKLNCVERTRKDHKEGRFCLNRNVLLYLFLFLGILSLTTTNLILNLFAFTLLSAYLSDVIPSISAGIYEVFAKKDENRDRIKAKLNK